MINLYEKPKLKKPVLIAAWPGMGNVAFRAINYLKEQIGAKRLGEISAEEYFAPTGASVINQVIEPIKTPKNFLYYYQTFSGEHDLLLFIGNEQPIPHCEYSFAKDILGLSQFYSIQKIFTTAAAPSDMNFNDESRVFAVPNQRHILDKLSEYPVHFMEEGTIAGLNGLLISVAGEMEIPGLCLLGEIPFFTAQIEYPKASLKVLEVLAKMLNLKIDLLDLELYASQKEKEIESLASLLVKDEHHEPPPPSQEKSFPTNETAEQQHESVPKSAYVQVEKLFKQAKFDKTYKSKMQLKEELDKWGLFDEFLDRFLDLFKKDQKES